MEQRKSRLITVPDLLEDHVVVSVRHTTRGIVRRLFLAEHTMNVVYDWIGSLQELPMYFNLDFKGDILKPFESVGDVKSFLNMAECDNPPSLEEDEEITMSGFSASESILVKDSAYDIGNEETQRFLTQLMNQELDRPSDSPVLSSLKCSCDTESMIKTYVKNLEERCTAAACILCHRDTVKFWDLVFRQNIDLSTNEIKVIWAGEAGADGGGLYREFLLFAVENFVNLSTQLFGASRYAFFSSFPAHISAKRYIPLGQICARSILHIGRGPSCLNPILVKAIFEHSLDVPIHLNQFEGDLLYEIKQLESGDNTSLIDANEVPTNDAAKNIELFVNAFCIITKYAAIEQFRKGIFSVCPKLLEYPCCFSKYFTDEKPSVKLENVPQIIKFVKTREKGSNLYQYEEEAILEFEMFLLNLSNNESGVDLTDFLEFVAATDRIPIQGFGKPTEIFFVDTDRYSTASTCGLYMTVPLKSICRETFEKPERWRDIWK